MVAQDAPAARGFCVDERRQWMAADSLQRIADSAAGRLDSIRAAQRAIADTTESVPPRLVKAGLAPLPRDLQNVPAIARAQFVVDSTGRVVKCSIELLEVTDPRFELFVRRRVERSRYAPGSVNGKPVPVLAQQTIRFD
jgi:hypothetical protein